MMVSKKGSEKEITLESIDKKLISITRKLNKLEKDKKGKKRFIANLLISLAFVLLAVSIPFFSQYFGYSKEALLIIAIDYIVMSFILIIMAGRVLPKI